MTLGLVTKPPSSWHYLATGIYISFDTCQCNLKYIKMHLMWQCLLLHATIASIEPVLFKVTPSCNVYLQSHQKQWVMCHIWRLPKKNVFTCRLNNNLFTWPNLWTINYCCLPIDTVTLSAISHDQVSSIAWRKQYILGGKYWKNVKHFITHPI